MQASKQASKWRRGLFSHVRLFRTPWAVAYQAPLSMGFSRQKYWSGLLFPSSGDLPNPGIKPRSPALHVDSLLFEPPGNPEDTGVSGLSLLQGNFPIQESNQGLLHCRSILNQPSYQQSLILNWILAKLWGQFYVSYRDWIKEYLYLHCPESYFLFLLGSSFESLC